MIDIAVAVPVALGAKKGVEPVIKEIKEILTGDIITIEGELFREVTIKVGRKKETRFVPIKYMARINALSIALGIGGLALAALFVGFGLWWSQLRLGVLTEAEKQSLRQTVAELEIQIVTLERFIELERAKPRGEIDLLKIKEALETLKTFKREKRRIELKLKAGLQFAERKGFGLGEVSLFG